MTDRPNLLPQHLGYLDGLRALAALYVVVHHSLLQMDLTPWTTTGPGAALRIFDHGHYAVDLFIVLSGFCLMLPVAKGDGTLRGGALSFFKRRAWRILPPYYFAMIVSLLLIIFCIGEKTGTHWDASVPVTMKSIVTHLFLVHDAVFLDYNINHCFWSIAVEWRIYFLFPLLVISWRHLGPLLTTIVALVLSYYLYAAIGHSIANSLHAHYIGLFALGMLATTITCEDGFLRHLPWAAITVLLLAVVALVTSAPLWRGEVMPVHLRDYIVGLWSMSLLIMISKSPDGLLNRFLSIRPLVFTGTFAYSIYLVHAPLIQLLWQHVFTHLRGEPMMMFAALTVIGTPLIVLCSYVFFLFFERPFITRKKPREQLPDNDTSRTTLSSFPQEELAHSN